MKLWDKGIPTEEKIEAFTVGRDRELDMALAPFDVYGSMAHAHMLAHIGLLTQKENEQLQKGLRQILTKITNQQFAIAPDMEDVHSQIEWMLTQELGDTGKKIHSGRSRNDQVLVAIRLYLRHELETSVQQVQQLFHILQKQSERHKDVLMPGYTHLQVAMPSSFGLWFGAYAEALTDDLRGLRTAYEVCNQNPLGSAAGYGSSFPLNRKMTTELLGFADLNYNVVYAQMGRGKTEQAVAMAMAALAGTLNKLAGDACLFISQNFGFIHLPDALTTGSSIMPHKKNPDVFELLRGRSNQLMALPAQLMSLSTNLPSGYFRDYQLLKEVLFPAIEQMHAVLDMMHFAVAHIRVQPDILQAEHYAHLFSVEAVNEQVLQGVPFREAYLSVAEAIANGTYTPPEQLHHTHEGSMGNLCHAAITKKLNEQLQGFPFKHVQNALQSLARLQATEQ